MAATITLYIRFTLDDEQATAYATEYAKDAELATDPQALAQDVSETITECLQISRGGGYLMPGMVYTRITGKRTR